jgi:hypothetical protein
MVKLIVNHFRLPQYISFLTEIEYIILLDQKSPDVFVQKLLHFHCWMKQHIPSFHEHFKPCKTKIFVVERQVRESV